jgi:hypothetical protein
MTVTEVSADWVLVPESVTAFATSRDEVRRGIAEQLYRELAPAVLGYLRSQRAPDPEDVLGEVFLHVARDAHRCRGDTDGGDSGCSRSPTVVSWTPGAIARPGRKSSTDQCRSGPLSM